MASTKTKDFTLVSDPMLEMVAGCFQALSDPTRLKLLRALQSGEKSVHDLVAMFTCTQPNISRHLFILTKAGMVKKVRRGSFVLYSVSNPRIFNLCDNVCTHVQGVLSRYAGIGKKG